MRPSPFRHMMLGACLVAPFLLAGCGGGDQGVPQTFPPLRYTYLAPISLNVGTVVTQVQYVPPTDGSSVDGMSPETPLDAVRQMIQDRLIAAGGSGTATVTISTASLTRVGDTVVGNLSIHLAVRSADGLRSGYTDATATRSRTTPDDTSDAAMRAFLYQLTQELVNAENVELEYQIRQNLGSWLVGGGSSVIGGPAAPTPVQVQDLGSSPPSTGGPTPLLAPPPSPGAVAPMPQLVPPSQLTSPAPVSAPAAPMAMPMTMPMPATPAPEPPTVEMPSGSLGMPQGNPVPQDVPPPPPPPAATPAPLTPTPPPAPVAPAPPPPASNGPLPPLPPGITP